MSHPVALGRAIFCVCLTALAQILLKAGMNTPVIQQAMDKGLLNVYWLALGSPMIWGDDLFWRERRSVAAGVDPARGQHGLSIDLARAWC